MRLYGLSIILLLTAIVFAGLGLFGYQKSNQLVTAGATTLGTVIRNEYSASTSSSNSGVYYPIIQFITDDGEDLEARGKLGSSPAQFKVGDKIKILYKKNDPRDWCVNTWIDLWLLPCMFAGLSALLFIAGFISAFTTRLEQKRVDQLVNANMNR